MKITQAKFAMSSTSVEGKPARRLPEFAFIGRSNVGKSSLINMLCGNRRLAMTSATPGKTKLVNHFIINDNWYIVDLPGYGFARLPARERKALHDIISDYLSNSLELVMLFVLVDSRHDPQKIDVDFIGELGEHNIPFGIVFTKGDKLGPVALQRQIDRYKQQLLLDWDTLPPCFVSSAETGLGKDEILGYIGQVLDDVREDFK
ncbi:MAG: YihA family ribosome biogenesis GTP-binding protein [Bacteroidales bacterium]|nr:YihA family ribosome biogenesis GTP-binding protein [Bacteroidales bacterium]